MTKMLAKGLRARARRAAAAASKAKLLVLGGGVRPAPLMLTLQWAEMDPGDGVSGWSLVAATDGGLVTIGDVEAPFGRNANMAEVAAWLRANLPIAIEVIS